MERKTPTEIPPIYWADRIDVTDSGNTLSICGRKEFPASAAASKSDVMKGYLGAITGAQSGDTNKAPHLIFGNCATDADLKKFVCTYGPVLASAMRMEATPRVGSVLTTKLRAEQRWEDLRREQRTLSSALRLFEEVRRPEPTADVLCEAAQSIVIGTSFWVEAFEHEEKTRERRPWQNSPSWKWTGKDHSQLRLLANVLKSPPNLDPVGQAHAVLDHLLNAFPALVTHYGGFAFEGPSEDLSFGVLPVLYFLLRCDYLWNARVTRCAWKDCTRWFRVGSHDSPCCCVEHSLKYRQAAYYKKRGKATRQRGRGTAKAVRR